MSHDALVINDVGGAEGTSTVGEASVVGGDFVSQVREHGESHWVETALLSLLLGPLLVGMHGVNGASENDTVHGIEFWLGIGELDDLSWAHEGEVEWVPHKHEVLALEVGELDLLELATVWVVNFSLKFRCWVLHSAHHWRLSWLRVHFLLN